ncbi:DUF459 domain-containing protein, partial [Brucella abortus]|nr:DUF459 domain-containing protein [Brucella abortus]
LLGGTPAMQAKPLKTEQKKSNPSPGRADDFSWPRNGKAPRK